MGSVGDAFHSQKHTRCLPPFYCCCWICDCEVAGVSHEDNYVRSECAPIYKPERDCVVFIDQEGDEVFELNRNAIIKLVGMLPGEPPKQESEPS